MTAGRINQVCFKPRSSLMSTSNDYSLHCNADRSSGHMKYQHHVADLIADMHIYMYEQYGVTFVNGGSFGLPG